MVSETEVEVEEVDGRSEEDEDAIVRVTQPNFHNKRQILPTGLFFEVAIPITTRRIQNDALPKWALMRRVAPDASHTNPYHYHHFPTSPASTLSLSPSQWYNICALILME